MAWGGLQIKGNDLHIGGTAAKCIDELYHVVLWHSVHQSIRKTILLLADTLAALDLAAVVKYTTT